MKGIILAGGAGTRLYPLTKVCSKQLLPIYDKPMIYYPLSVLMQAGIREILIISTPTDIDRFKDLLGDGEDWGMQFSYKIQPSPDGLAQAFLLGEEFINGDSCALILGDNIFFGHNFEDYLHKAVKAAAKNIATVFGYRVNDPQRFGIIEIDDDGIVLSIEEKPEKPKSNYCVTGLYFYGNDVVDFAKRIRPSIRNELEITDLNNLYLKEHRLQAFMLGRGFAWLDAGTIDSLIEANNFVQTISKRQGLTVSALEEIAFNNGWISLERLILTTKKYGASNYGQYLQTLIAENISKGLK